MGFHFFGLTLEYRAHLFNQIHEIVFHGKGGFDFDTVYSMPIWLRRFTFQKISEFYEKEKEEHEKAQGKSTANEFAKGPAIKQPSYSSKARK